MDSNHCQVVKESITGRRLVDEQTFASLTILNERLEQLKKLGGMFSDVDFSPAVQRLKGPKKTVAVS